MPRIIESFDKHPQYNLPAITVQASVTHVRPGDAVAGLIVKSVAAAEHAGKPAVRLTLATDISSTDTTRMVVTASKEIVFTKCFADLTDQQDYKTHILKPLVGRAPTIEPITKPPGSAAWIGYINKLIAEVERLHEVDTNQQQLIDVLTSRVDELEKKTEFIAADD